MVIEDWSGGERSLARSLYESTNVNGCCYEGMNGRLTHTATILSVGVDEDFVACFHVLGACK